MQLITLAKLNDLTVTLDKTEALIKEAYAHAIITGAPPAYYELLGLEQQYVCDNRELVETIKFDIASNN